MKKRVLYIILCIIVACIGLYISGCGNVYGSKESCIPDKLGASEGLYLYYDNYRSLTDGLYRERLVNDIVVDGETYTVDEYCIEDIEYMTTKKEIVYSIRTTREGEDTVYILWHYNYDTKQSGLVRTFGAEVSISTSEYYLLVTASTEDGLYSEGILYDWDYSIVQEGIIGYTLRKDMLYKKKGPFSWWKNGNFYSVDVYWEYSSHYNVMYEDYAYKFAYNRVYCIDLNTGEYKLKVLGDDTQYYGGVGDTYVRCGNDVYFITYAKTETIEAINPDNSSNVTNRGETLYQGSKLWRITGLDVQAVYVFSEKYEIELGSYDENYINLTLRYYSRTKHFFRKISIGTHYTSKKSISAYYDIQEGELVKRSQKTVTRPAAPKKRLTVGEYQFYTESEVYETSGEIGTCYYLHRITNGYDEIIQYYFDEYGEANPVLYDDIHTI